MKVQYKYQNIIDNKSVSDNPTRPRDTGAGGDLLLVGGEARDGYAGSDWSLVRHWPGTGPAQDTSHRTLPAHVNHLQQDFYKDFQMSFKIFSENLEMFLNDFSKIFCPVNVM